MGGINSLHVHCMRITLPSTLNRPNLKGIVEFYWCAKFCLPNSKLFEIMGRSSNEGKNDFHVRCTCTMPLITASVIPLKSAHRVAPVC